MGRIKEILQNIEVIYKGVEITKVSPLKHYMDYLCDIVDAEDKHIASITLSTGSIFYHVATVAVSTLACLFYNNTNIEDLIEALNIDDILLYKKERVKFKGITDGGTLGLGFEKNTKYFAIEGKNSSRWIKLSAAKKINISIYQGSANTLGGKGVRSTLKERKEFLSEFVEKKDQTEISTQINNSIAIISDKELAEDLYKNIYIKYKNKTIPLSKLVTAAYFSENEIYSLGSNPTKEEPILQFFSRVSVCRQKVIEDQGKRLLGCVVAQDVKWESNSEIHDISDRKKIKFVILEGKTHFTKYNDWLKENEKYSCYAVLPENIPLLTEGAEKIPNLNYNYFMEGYKKYRNRRIFESEVERDDDNLIFEIKQRLLKIKNQSQNSEFKEDFIITSYFLLNLCRSAFFPLSYCDRANEKQILEWSLNEKVNQLKTFATNCEESLAEDVEFVIRAIANMVQELYITNPKADEILEDIESVEIDCIVATKAYYEILFSLWLDDCNIDRKKRPAILTVSAFERSDKAFNNVIFVTGYYDFLFNPYANFSYVQAKLLFYSYEYYWIKKMAKEAEQGKKLISKINNIPSHTTIVHDIELQGEEQILIEQEEDFESEMDVLMKDLQLQSAYRYLANTNQENENTTKIAKVITFVSGNTGFFTKYYKGYRIEGTEISDVDIKDLKVGDSIVFTKQTENKDIIDILLKRFLDRQQSNNEYAESYKLSLCWKDALKKYIREKGISYQELAHRLGQVGCHKEPQTVRAWLYEETHIVGPRDKCDYESIVRLTMLQESPERIQVACGTIRRLRRQILDLLGKAILKGLFAESSDPLWKIVSEKAENLSQIEQITSIVDASENARVPLHMINKPCDI